MLVLLDESVPRQLARTMDGHEVRTVAQMGWSSTENGELLHLAATAGFGALITADRNLEYQQNVARAGLGVVVLISPSNSPGSLLPLAPAIVAALGSCNPVKWFTSNQSGVADDAARQDRDTRRPGGAPSIGP